jgi:hypothetical protein
MRLSGGPPRRQRQPDDVGVPDVMQILPGLPIEEDDRDIISAAVIIVLAMQWLIYIADEMDELFERFEPLRRRGRTIGERPGEVDDLDDAIAAPAIVIPIVAVGCKRDVEISEQLGSFERGYRNLQISARAV